MMHASARRDPEDKMFGIIATSALNHNHRNDLKTTCTICFCNREIVEKVLPHLYLMKHRLIYKLATNLQLSQVIMIMKKIFL